MEGEKNAGRFSGRRGRGGGNYRFSSFLVWLQAAKSIHISWLQSNIFFASCANFYSKLINQKTRN